MDIHRRNLMKGAVTGGTLLALGIPPGAFASASTRRVGKFGLLLGGNARVDGAFAAGVRMAYAATITRARENGVAASEAAEQAEPAGRGWHHAPPVVKLKGGLLNEYEEVAKLLESARGARWIAVLDDGSAAVFTELVRNAGVRLLLRGSHAASSDDDASRPDIFQCIPELRHIWTAASSTHGAGGILASRLITNHGNFSIVENFLSEEHSSVPTDSRMANGLIPGFLTYRLDGPGGPDEVDLHCSGLSAADGCGSIGWNMAGTWTPVTPHGTASGAGASARPRVSQLPSASWVESVGYAAMVAALGIDSHQVFCSRRAFVHQSPSRKQRERIGPPERFTSFVIET